MSMCVCRHVGVFIHVYACARVSVCRLFWVSVRLQAAQSIEDVLQLIFILPPPVTASSLVSMRLTQNHDDRL